MVIVIMFMTDMMIMVIVMLMTIEMMTIMVVVMMIMMMIMIMMIEVFVRFPFVCITSDLDMLTTAYFTRRIRKWMCFTQQKTPA